MRHLIAAALLVFATTAGAQIVISHSEAYGIDSYTIRCVTLSKCRDKMAEVCGGGYKHTSTYAARRYYFSATCAPHNKWILRHVLDARQRRGDDCREPAPLECPG